MSKKPALTVEWVDTESLIPSPTNPKLHPPDQVAQIAASIQQFGFNDPVGVNGDNTVIEGHGRLLAAQKLGLKQVPVIRLNHLTIVQQKAYLLAHNKLTLNTEWDLELLRTEFEQLQELGFEDLTITGFQSAELQVLFNPPELPDSEPLLDETLLAGKEDKAITCPECGHTFSHGH